MERAGLDILLVIVTVDVERGDERNAVAAVALSIRVSKSAMIMLQRRAIAEVAVRSRSIEGSQSRSGQSS